MRTDGKDGVLQGQDMTWLNLMEIIDITIHNQFRVAAHAAGCREFGNSGSALPEFRVERDAAAVLTQPYRGCCGGRA